MTTGITIKHFHKKELHQLIQLIHLTIKRCYPECYAQEVVDFFINYHSSEELLRKAEVGKLVVGYKGDVLIASGYFVEGEIGGVYIHPGYQQQGFAKEIVTFLLDLAKKEGSNSVWLESTPLALKLYKQLGFYVDEERVMYVGNNTPLPYYHMRKKF